MSEPAKAVNEVQSMLAALRRGIDEDPANTALMIERLVEQFEQAKAERGTLLCAGTTLKPEWTPLGETIRRLEAENAKLIEERDVYRQMLKLVESIPSMTDAELEQLHANAVKALRMGPKA